MDQQIVDPDPSENYNAAISAGDLHFQIEKKKYAPQSSKS